MGHPTIAITSCTKECWLFTGSQNRCRNVRFRTVDLCKVLVLVSSLAALFPSYVEIPQGPFYLRALPNLPGSHATAHPLGRAERRALSIDAPLPRGLLRRPDGEASHG